ADQLQAAERIIVLFSAILPIAATLPLQWIAAGPRALVAAAMTAVFGLLWAEVLLRDWRRIPFTCSYVPGKRTVAQSFILRLFIFLLAGTIAGVFELEILRGRLPMPILGIVALLLAGTIVARRQRRKMWRLMPLVFDDELPSDVQVFTLSDLAERGGL